LASEFYRELFVAGVTIAVCVMYCIMQCTRVLIEYRTDQKQYGAVPVLPNVDASTADDGDAEDI
jgi:hypothetical protein